MKLDKAYISWIKEVKEKIRLTQIKAALTVNSQLIVLYWDLGKMINEKENVWGSQLVDQVAKDLKNEFPKMKGLSRTNLYYCKKFYSFYTNLNVQQVVGQLPKPKIGQQPVDQSEDAYPTVQQPVGQSKSKALAKVPQL